MGTISERKRKNGSKSYIAQIRIMRQGKTVHTEAQTFDRRPAAAAWLKKRETELAEPGALERNGREHHTLADAIDTYIADTQKEIGRTKAQVLKSIKDYAIANLECRRIRSEDIVSFAQELLDGRAPQTVGNYISHLAAIFAIAKPAWGIPLDRGQMQEAQTVMKRLGITSNSRSRDRRPTLEELDKLLRHYIDRRKRVPKSVPMKEIIIFALFSTRRQEEISLLRWDDYQENRGRILVRDMKHPGEKEGNDVWCFLPPPAVAVINSMPRKGERIFPYSAETISASFTRACALLGIENLHFHDLRHEGVSRLFEMGWSIPQAATVSGHRSWASLKRYAHLDQTGDKYEGWAWIADKTEAAVD